MLKDKTICWLVITVALFHIANAPVMPLVGLYLKHLGGGDDKVAMVVLVAQVVMIPVALLAGKFCSSRGRKPVFAIAFLVLPLRIFLYSITTNPNMLLAIQTLVKQLESVTNMDFAQCDYISAHRWRYANLAQRKPLQPYVDESLKLASAGDWCTASRIEDVWLAARNLAGSIRNTLEHD